MTTKYHLVKYVFNSEPRLRKFKTLKAMNAWIASYKKKHKDVYEGYWVDFSVTNITGDVTILDDVNIPLES